MKTSTKKIIEQNPEKQHLEHQKDNGLNNIEEKSTNQEEIQTPTTTTDKKYFCQECRKIVNNDCSIDSHQDYLIPTEQLELDFKKYKLFCEQNDPLYNIAKSLNKIQEALKYLEIPALKRDYQLKQKVFDENSKIEDFIDKIIYKEDRLLIDDLDVLPNLDDLKKEQYLIDMVQSNYQIIKQYLNRYQLYRYENNQMQDDPLIKAENISNDSDYDMEDYGINQKRRNNFNSSHEFYEYQRQNMKKRKPNSDNINSFNSNFETNEHNNNSNPKPSLTPQTQQQQQENNSSTLQQQQGGFLHDENEGEKLKKASIDKDVGLEHMNQKEREILQKMYNTQYEKHHRFTDLEKRMFAKFALLRKIKDGINVSVTTEQWRLNRITVQLWLDKYKKLLKQKHEI